jgi:hypothetical protein
MLLCVEQNQKITSFLQTADINSLPLIRSLRFHTMLRFMSKTTFVYPVPLLQQRVFKKGHNRLQWQNEVLPEFDF